jgi:hypothetical protein
MTIGWKVSVDDVSQRNGTPSQAEPTSAPEAIEDQQSSGRGPSEKHQRIGSPSIRAGIGRAHCCEIACG